jgi:glutamate 5-kinase
MSNPLAQYRRLTVKIGSALLVDRAGGGLRADWLAGLATDVAMIRARGTDVVLVSSGSIALGRIVLGLPKGPLALEQSQAAASVGQIRLARDLDRRRVIHEDEQREDEEQKYERLACGQDERRSPQERRKFRPQPSKR